MMKKAEMLKRVLAAVLSLLLVLSLAACTGKTAGDETGTNGPAGADAEPADAADRQEQADSEKQPAAPSDQADDDASKKPTSPAAPDEPADGRILIAYFSHTGENYNVGVIEKGNTHIIADMIAEETGADLFEITTVQPYPDVYEACTDVARQEQNDNARPDIVDPPDSLDGYDTIFIGYPIWWGDLPMAVYTFLERYDFSGKTVIPFCTHEGSGLSGTARSIEDTCAGATVLEGLAIRGSVAQNEQEKAKADVTAWLDELQM